MPDMSSNWIEARINPAPVPVETNYIIRPAAACPSCPYPGDAAASDRAARRSAGLSSWPDVGNATRSFRQ